MESESKKMPIGTVVRHKTTNPQKEMKVVALVDDEYVKCTYTKEVTEVFHINDLEIVPSNRTATGGERRGNKL